MQNLLLAYETQVEYLRLVVEEVDKALIKVDNRLLVEALMKNYGKHLQKEIEHSQSVGRELTKKFVQEMCQR